MSIKGIATYAEKLREIYPEIPAVEIVKIWREQYVVSGTEFLNINLENISTTEMVYFILKVHEKFPENPLVELFKICTVEEYKPKICQHIQRVLGGKDLTSGECSLGQTITM